MLNYPILLAIIMSGVTAYGQGVIVNPDGTHSTVHGSGNSGIIVNPNGTHTTIHGSDVDPAIINSTRNHSLIPDSGDTNQDRKQRIKRNKRRRTLPDQELN